MLLGLLWLARVHAIKSYDESEYIRCKCNTRVATRYENMSVIFGGEDRCIYPLKHEIKSPTAPFRDYDAATGETFCKALGGSCFHVEYYHRYMVNDEARQDCVKSNKTVGASLDDKAECVKSTFYFAGCAVNHTRRMEEELELQKSAVNEAAQDELDMQHITVEEFPSMCKGKTKKHNVDDSNYDMKSMGLKEIHHIDISKQTFSRVYCCDEENCNKDDVAYRGKLRKEWMYEMDLKIREFDVNKTRRLLNSSSTRSISIFLILIALLLFFMM